MTKDISVIIPAYNEQDYIRDTIKSYKRQKENGFKSELKIGEDTDLSRRMKSNGAKYKFLHSTHIIRSLRKF